MILRYWLRRRPRRDEGRIRRHEGRQSGVGLHSLLRETKSSWHWWLLHLDHPVRSDTRTRSLELLLWSEALLCRCKRRLPLLTWLWHTGLARLWNPGRDRQLARLTIRPYDSMLCKGWCCHQ